MKLPQSYYLGSDVVAISKSLLGKYLFTSINGLISGGYITETEAYNGVVDRASHAFGNRKTPRTQIMYEAGGIAYIYLCYGIHEMLNVVTSVEGQPHAILIRAIEPTTCASSSSVYTEDVPCRMELRDIRFDCDW